MKALRYSGKRFCKNAASAVLVLLSLTACADKDNQNKPSEPGPLKEVTFTIDAEGGFTAKDADGKPIGTACSSNPKSPDACPIFDPNHKVQVENMSNISLVKYSGSPQCYLVIVNGVAYVLPSAAYCKK